MNSIVDLRQFVIYHAKRGTCCCGKCIDHPGKDRQPEGHTIDMVLFEMSAKNDPNVNRFRELIAGNKQGDFCELDPWDGKEHSCFEVGGWIGDQGLALMLMGLGAICGLWSLMTPKMLPGLPDNLVQMMAAQGMITIMSSEAG